LPAGSLVVSAHTELSPSARTKKTILIPEKLMIDLQVTGKRSSVISNL
jgi:hypothetical protein